MIGRIIFACLLLTGAVAYAQAPTPTPQLSGCVPNGECVANALVGVCVANGQCVLRATPTASPTATPPCPFFFTDDTGDSGTTCQFRGSYDSVHLCTAATVPVDAVFFGDGNTLTITLATSPPVSMTGKVHTTTTAEMLRLRIDGQSSQAIDVNVILDQKGSLTLIPLVAMPNIRYCAYSRGCTHDESCILSGYAGKSVGIVNATHPPSTPAALPLVHQE